jgi:hypothetical protein
MIIAVAINSAPDNDEPGELSDAGVPDTAKRARYMRAETTAEPFLTSASSPAA